MIEVIRKKVLQKADICYELSDEQLRSIIDDVIIEESRHMYIPVSTMEALRKSVFASIRGLDILEELLEDSAVSEIMVNGNDNIYIEKNGQIHKLDKTFSAKDKINDVIQHIAATSNKRINESSPISDTTLYDGSRANIVLSPISVDSPVITIRKFGSSRLTMAGLLEYGSLTEPMVKLLRCLVKARYNIFVCGGTGSGKTTFLNALSEFIPKDERIITIEDSTELNIAIDNLVRLETRDAGSDGSCGITIRDLIRTSLRMRPDRIIVGEVRGPEAIDMLQAMNTGHDGSLSTGHGNSVEDMLNRLETMILMGLNIPLEAIRSMIASSIDIIIHLGRLHDKSRKVLEISEITGIEDGRYRIHPICILEKEGDCYNHKFVADTFNLTYKLINHNLLEEVNDIMKGQL